MRKYTPLSETATRDGSGRARTRLGGALHLQHSRRRQRELEAYAYNLISEDNLTLIVDKEAKTAEIKNYQDNDDQTIITIPTFDLDNPFPEFSDKDFYKNLQYAELIHECGHYLYTDYPAAEQQWEDVIKQHVSGYPDPVQQAIAEWVKGIWNAIEDGAIEETIRRENGEMIARKLALKNQTFVARSARHTDSGETELSFDAALQVAALDLAKYDTGSLRRLHDEDDSSVTFADESDENLYWRFYDDLCETVAMALSTPDGAARTKQIFSFIEELLHHLLPDGNQPRVSDPDQQAAQGPKGQDDPRDGGKAPQAEANQALQQADPAEIAQRQATVSQQPVPDPTGSDESGDTDADETDSGAGRSVGGEADTGEQQSEGERGPSAPASGQEHHDTPSDTSESDEADSGGAEAVSGDGEDTGHPPTTPETDTPQEDDELESDTAEQSEDGQAEDGNPVKPDESESGDDNTNENLSENGEASDDEDAGETSLGTGPDTDDSVQQTLSAFSEDASSEGTDDEQVANSEGTGADEGPAQDGTSEKIEGEGEDDGQSGDTAQEDTPGSPSDDQHASAEQDTPSGPSGESENDSEPGAESSTDTGANEDPDPDTNAEDPAVDSDSTGQPNSEDGTSGRGPMSSDPNDDDHSESSGEPEPEGGRDDGCNAGDKSHKPSSEEATTIEPEDPDSTPPGFGNDDYEPDPELVESSAQQTNREERELQRVQQQTEQERQRFEQALQATDSAGGGDIGELQFNQAPKGSTSDPRWSEAKQEHTRVAQYLKKLLKEARRDKRERGKQSGKLDSSRLSAVAAKQTDVMQRIKQGDNKDYSVIIVLDRSASMRGSRIKIAEDALIRFGLALEDLNVEVCMIDMYDNSARVISPFNVSLRQAKGDILTGEIAGGTPLSDVIRLARARMRIASGNPILLSITDGLPDDLDQYQDELDQCHFPVMGVTIGNDDSEFENIYTSHAAVTTEKELLEELERLTTQTTI